jgi:hypothetical protein
MLGMAVSEDISSVRALRREAAVEASAASGAAASVAGFELGCVVNRCRDPLHCEGWSGGLEGVQKIFGIWRRCRVEQEGDPVNARRDLLEQLQPLAGHRRLHSSETSDVAARPRKARDEAAADRINNGRENDGDGACLL